MPFAIKSCEHWLLTRNIYNKKLNIICLYETGFKKYFKLKYKNQIEIIDISFCKNLQIIPNKISLIIFLKISILYISYFA